MGMPEKPPQSTRILGLKPLDAVVFLAWVGLTADSLYWERYWAVGGEFFVGALYFLYRGITRPDVEEKRDDDDDDDHGPTIKDLAPVRA